MFFIYNFLGSGDSGSWVGILNFEVLRSVVSIRYLVFGFRGCFGEWLYFNCFF